MVRQIGPHFQEPSMIVLQERIHRLEDKVAALSDAVQYLMRELDQRSREPVDALVSETAEVVPHRV
jgi:predicted nuclease with TOPRIM domain